MFAAAQAVTNPLASVLSDTVTVYTDDKVDDAGTDVCTVITYGPLLSTGFDTLPVTTVGPVAILSHRYRGAVTKLGSY